MLFLEIAMLNGYSGIRTRPGRAEQDFWTLGAYECPDPQLDFTVVCKIIFFLAKKDEFCHEK